MDIFYEALDEVTDKVRHVGEALQARFAAAGLKVSSVRETTNIMDEPVLALDIEDPRTGETKTFEAQEIFEYFLDGRRPLGNSVTVMPKRERVDNGRLSTEIPFNRYANNHPEELGGVDVVADCIIEHLKTGKRVFMAGNPDSDTPLTRYEADSHIYYSPQKP